MNEMFCDKENLKKLIETFEKHRKDHSLIVLIQTKDLESVNLNKISKQYLFYSGSSLKFRRVIYIEK